MAHDGTGQERTVSDPQQNHSEELVVTCRFGFRYVKVPEGQASIPDDESKLEVAAEVQASIAIIYAINRAAQPDEARRKAWVQRHGLLHAWPYWREVCQSSLVRMNLPSTVMPLVEVSDPDPGPTPSIEQSSPKKRSAPKRKPRAGTAV